MGKGEILNDGSFFLYYSSIATILIDVLALLYLVGIIVCTRAYRKRGRLSDKIFFAGLILNIALAVSDAMIICCCGYTAAGVMFFGSVQMVLHTVMGFITVLYLSSFLPSGDTRLQKLSKLYVIPVLAMAVLVVINLFTNILFFADVEQDYVYAEGSDLLYCFLGVYVIIAIVLLWRISKRGMIALILLLVTGTILANLFYDISTLVFDYAVLLSYLLVGSMNRAFHEEEQ